MSNFVEMQPVGLQYMALIGFTSKVSVQLERHVQALAHLVYLIWQSVPNNRPKLG